jgi:hypothetical protein
MSGTDAAPEAEEDAHEEEEEPTKEELMQIILSLKREVETLKTARSETTPTTRKTTTMSKSAAIPRGFTHGSFAFSTGAFAATKIAPLIQPSRSQEEPKRCPPVNTSANKTKPGDEVPR